MGASYATVEDLKLHWPKMPEDTDDEATQKLMEASIEVRVNYPDVDRRILAGVLDHEVPRLVVCRMVKRAMAVDDDAPAQGMESFQFGAGPFQFGGKALNPDGNVYLSAADKRLLRVPRAGGAFTTYPGGVR